MIVLRALRSRRNFTNAERSGSTAGAGFKTQFLLCFLLRRGRPLLDGIPLSSQGWALAVDVIGGAVDAYAVHDDPHALLSPRSARGSTYFSWRQPTVTNS